MHVIGKLAASALAGTLVAIAAPSALAAPPPVPTHLSPAVRVVGLTTSNGLTSIDTGKGKASRTKAIKGIASSEDVVGIDYRPANNKLYGLVQRSNGALRVVKISPATGRTYASHTLIAASGRAVTSTASSLGTDFDPVSGLMRVVDVNRNNVRVNVDTGLTVVDGTLHNARGDQYEVVIPRVPALAFTNSAKGASQTVGYTLNAVNQTIESLDPADDGTLNTEGYTVDVRGKTGYDIATLGGRTNVALISNTSGDQTRIYRVNIPEGNINDAGVLQKVQIKAKKIKDIAAPTGR
ncbi:DUF4394 domain-containing protein [Solicola sp. PLA-1-18]|uniref:DUF4394 domain-containing protein n=1 Tax=Solicola sp. PLA-1-18 TaxID=3380532 RepID=UPI003B827CB4